MVADTPTNLDDTAFPNLCTELVTDYLPALPVDPDLNDQDGIEAADCAVAGWNTDYEIARDANDRITVSAPNAYSGPIEVTR